MAFKSIQREGPMGKNTGTWTLKLSADVPEILTVNLNTMICLMFSCFSKVINVDSFFVSDGLFDCGFNR